jgi:RNA polymerase sigma-70 factor (ECF subfamily)
MAMNLPFLRRNALDPASNDPGGAGAPHPATDSTLEQAIEGCREGSREAQRQLYDACSERVYALMVRIVGVQNAADVTQQVFLRVFKKIDNFQGHSRFETWLYRLATNEAYQFLRKERRWKHAPLGHDPRDGQTSVEHINQEKELLEEALRRVDVELRTIFLLREVEELSYQELAEVLKISEGTVASRLNRARRTLRSVLTDLGWEDGA